ncbi:MAG: hypothetical protein IKE90_04075, partial [Bacilli bacterium]|nr:hypothetical protein [Bacilli bacterium]
LAILSFNKVKDLRKLSEGDEMLMRVVKKIEELTDDPDMVQYIDVEKGMEYGHKLDIQEAVEKAEKKAEEKAQKVKIETARKMLEDGLDNKLISKYTGLTNVELEKLKK